MTINKKSVLTKDELKKSIGIKGIIGTLIAHFLMHVLYLNKINKIYRIAYDKDSKAFLSNIFNQRKNKIQIRESEIQSIPEKGPVIFVANHPFGGWDGMALIKTLSEKRPDVKFLVNFMLHKVEPIKPYLIGVNPFEEKKSIYSSFSGIREMHEHIQNKNALVLFPAGEVSSKYGKLKRVEDRDWQENIIKFIKSANCPVVPIFISGRNSALFHFLGRIHPALRTLRLPAELVRKRNTEIKIRIGAPLPISFFKKIDNLKELGKTLKATTYCLNTKLEETSEFNINFSSVPIKQQHNQTELFEEIESIKQHYQLFASENYSCFLAPYDKMPLAFAEIARLREVTFRTVGEGTGNELDFDNFDKYYHHLFLWDNNDKKIAGAYRLGLGEKIFNEVGVKGFYLNSLFNFKKDFETVLKQSIELGRSFIAQEYQRKTLPLFLLWKGINITASKYPQYKYLLGPVSISSMYSVNSTVLMLEFLKRHHSNKELAKYVVPKIEFKYKLNRHHRAILKFSGNDIKKIDKIIKCVDVNSFSMPVLVKKYISLGGKILKFNVDPDFNYAIDGLVILNISEVSQEVRKSFE